MSSVLDRVPLGSRVAVIRLRSMGDSILATPALHLLKQARPDLQIGLVSEERFAPVYAGNPDVSAVLAPGARELRRFRPALCLNLHGGTRSARLTLASGARWRAGFGHYRFQAIYNVRIPRAQQILGVERTVHTAEHAASAMFHLGVPQQEIPRARLFVSAASPLPLHEPYAVIHASASAPEKTWPAPSFMNVAQHLKRELGLQPVFVAGPGEDVSPFQRWPAVAGASLESLKALIAGASLFVGNDSGPAHMAAAFGVPLVVLFGPSDATVWAPWKCEAQVFKANGPIHSISDQEVMRALDRMRVHA
ncbi:glycosyltransferase family 9 protein [Nevskia soli]|jgi:ADP-heptose:LPS heptosyltransferase|uniref:glycosyltransferase family 9 protein n=1 Tax=Nevskia soli TaxID=418856 RepID=UPI0015D7AF10|nr:glycosyltransferase family 9 protein [Nevskia soli]